MWISLGFAAIFVSALAVEPFPLEDSALFEYAGRAMSHGQRLYLDVWDNKLPSIFFVNEAWQALFGQRYFLHVAAQTLVNALSVALFAAILLQSRIAGWALASSAFAVLISFRYFNSSEQYALACILLAYLLALRGNGVGSGIVLALATTFWIPAIVLAIPLLVREKDGPTRWRFALAFGITLGAYAAIMLAAFGGGVVRELVRSWFWYEHHSRPGGVTGTRSPFRIVSLLYSVAIASAVGPLIALLFLVIRKPRSGTESFALWWSGSALAAAAVNSHLYSQHFLPAIAPLLFAIAAYGFTWSTVRPRIVLALAAGGLAWAWVTYTISDIRSQKTAAADARMVGDRIQRALGTDAVIFSEAYAPEIYLASAASLPDRFAIVAPIAAMQPFIESRSGVRARGPAVVLIRRRPNERPHTGEESLVCGRAIGSWEIHASPATISKFACR
ncbi:MAG: hypothetical protein JWO85_1347 [Candidatus Eremiobacteraeota bacterium]|nr:hypothetical protein [Candidatus Eremiobacteraeota bacterium]